MSKKTGLRWGLVLVSLFLLTRPTLAGPIPPAEKQTEVTSAESGPVTYEWHLRNGAFDQAWNDNLPQFWQVYAGDADAYGSLDFLNPDSDVKVVDNAFVFQMINDEVQGGQNAYLYQELALAPGDYWINVHSTIYGTGTGFRRSTDPNVPNAYTYVSYYALIPRAEAMSDGSFTPQDINAEVWKELWPWSSVCSEEVKGWGVDNKLSDCDYVKRAETVSVAGGEYVFILRAELKWPDWRAFAFYIFDDIQIISATPFEETWNACVDSFCLDGLIKR